MVSPLGNTWGLVCPGLLYYGSGVDTPSAQPKTTLTKSSRNKQKTAAELSYNLALQNACYILMQWGTVTLLSLGYCS